MDVYSGTGALWNLHKKLLLVASCLHNTLISLIEVHSCQSIGTLEDATSIYKKAAVGAQQFRLLPNSEAADV